MIHRFYMSERLAFVWRRVGREGGWWYSGETSRFGLHRPKGKLLLPSPHSTIPPHPSPASGLPHLVFLHLYCPSQTSRSDSTSPSYIRPFDIFLLHHKPAIQVSSPELLLPALQLSSSGFTYSLLHPRFSFTTGSSSLTVIILKSLLPKAADPPKKTKPTNTHLKPFLSSELTPESKCPTLSTSQNFF